MTAQISEPHRSRARQIAEGCIAIRRASDKLISDLNAAGIRFPESIDIILTDLSHGADRLGIILRDHISEDNSLDRHPNPSTQAGHSIPGAHAPAQDRREEANK